jgi:hypothetical protein
MSPKTRNLAVGLAALMLFCFANAQAAIDKPVIGHVSFGPSFAQGKTGDFLESGWALHGGATWMSPSRPMGLRLDFGVDWFDMKRSVLDLIDTTPETPATITPPDNGDARSWSGTVDFIWNPSNKGKVGFYLVGGVGVYYSQYGLSENGYGTGYWCDWYWGYCYPTLVEGEYLIESGSTWDWGLNAGAGVTFELSSGAELYLEAVYHWVDTKEGAEFLPVTLGIRW